MEFESSGSRESHSPSGPESSKRRRKGMAPGKRAVTVGQVQISEGLGVVMKIKIALLVAAFAMIPCAFFAAEGQEAYK